jgi:hypothetical protein
VGWEHYAFLLIAPIAVVLRRALAGDDAPWARVLALTVAFASIALLGINMHLKIAVRDFRYATGRSHARFHLLEAANWAPWALVMAYLLWVLRLETPRRAAPAVARDDSAAMSWNSNAAQRGNSTTCARAMQSEVSDS